jgi:hypothetical protein
MHREYNGRAHGLKFYNSSDLPEILATFPQPSSPQHPPLKIALITAGELRSFVFVIKSWEKYFLKKYKHSIKIFGHLLRGSNCSLYHHNLQKFHSLATEYEIYSPRSSFNSPSDLLHKFPSSLKETKAFEPWFQRFSSSSRGNFLDMFTRRKRAYDLAISYSEAHNFKWDLIFFVRPDTAFYDPSLDLYSIFQTIHEFEAKNSISSSIPSSASSPGAQTILSHGIFVPGSCNFGGVCDRFAIGTPEAMNLYFELDWVFKVINWAFSPPNITSDVFLLSQLLPRGKYENLEPNLDFVTEMRKEVTEPIGGPTSETMLSLWFVLKNITQLNYDRNLAFATIRVEHADAYCNMTRLQYIYQHPNRTAGVPLPETFLWDPDKHPSYDIASAYARFDFVASYEQRCGGHLEHLNVTKICQHQLSCHCNKPYGFLYMGI